MFFPSFNFLDVYIYTFTTLNKTDQGINTIYIYSVKKGNRILAGQIIKKLIQNKQRSFFTKRPAVIHGDNKYFLVITESSNQCLS